MPSRDELDAQIAELQKQRESLGEDDYNIRISDGDKSVEMPSRAGTPWLKKHFPDLYEELLGEPDEPDEPGKKKPAGKPEDDPKVTRFGRRVS